MIADALFFIVGSLLSVIAGVFSAIVFVMPLSWSTAISYFVSKLAVLENFFPVSTLMADLGIILVFLGIWYGIKIVFWIMQFIPGFKHESTPKLNAYGQTQEQRWGEIIKGRKLRSKTK